MSDIKLKSCPFCGGEARYYYQRENESVVCYECGAKLTYFGFGEDAQKELAKQWNSRPIEDTLKAENTQLRDLEKEIINLKQKLNEARDTLRYYSDIGNYSIKESYHMPPIMEDRGKMATNCLNKINK